MKQMQGPKAIGKSLNLYKDLTGPYHLFFQVNGSTNIWLMTFISCIASKDLT